MSALPKWTKERTDLLLAIVDGEEQPISQSVVAEAAAELDTTALSVAAKLRKLEFTVESAAKNKESAFTADQGAELASFVEDNSGTYTYAELAEKLFDGKYTPKQIQGKVLSMELNEHVAPSPVKEYTSVFTEEESAKIVDLAKSGAFIEDIAEALGKPIKSVRGKILSLSRSDSELVIPKQREYVSKEVSDPFDSLENIGDMTVQEIAEAIGKSERGVKTMLTHRGIDVANHKGAARRAKLDAKNAA